jgi:hypothetical protein
MYCFNFIQWPGCVCCSWASSASNLAHHLPFSRPFIAMNMATLKRVIALGVLILRMAF